VNNKIIAISIAAALVGIFTLYYVAILEPNSDTIPTTEKNQNEKFGLVINTPNTSTSLQELDSIYRTAASTGIGRSNVYLFWNQIEPVKGQFDWEQSDILMSFNKNNNLKVTLYFSIINGKTLGPFPDWIGNPPIKNISKENLVNVLDVILSRYDPIDTVIIAGGTDEHFRYNEQNIPVYNDLFSHVYQEIKDKHPDVEIGNVFYLHNVINKNLQDIVTEVAIGDFVGFNYLPVDSLNDIVQTPAEARNNLELILELAEENKIGLFEVSWSTSSFVGGSNKDQVEFVREVYDFFSDNHEKIEFVTWYRQHDKPEDACKIDAELVEGSVSIGGGSEIGSSEFVIERLENYLCSSGLINNSGDIKPAWTEFKNQIQSLSK